MRLIFLLSDSRSGSTFLARTLHNAFQNIAVTPELSLLPAMRLAKKNDRFSGADLRSALTKGRFFKALDSVQYPFDDDQMLARHDMTAFVIHALTEFSHDKWPTREVTQIIIKKGHHAWCVADIEETFPGCTFICLQRDPRAVYESKKRTVRPYRPWEKMGWAGLTVTTLRWRQYAQALHKIAQTYPSIRVRYEDLALKPGDVLACFATFLGARYKHSEEDGYLINPTEQEIHGKSLSGEIRQDTLESWRITLGKIDRRVIEFLTRGQLQEQGYGLEFSRFNVMGALASCGSGLVGAWRIFRRKVVGLGRVSDEV